MTLTVAWLTGLKIVPTEDGVCMTAVYLKVLELSATLDLQALNIIFLLLLCFANYYVIGMAQCVHANITLGQHYVNALQTVLNFNKAVLCLLG